MVIGPCHWSLAPHSTITNTLPPKPGIQHPLQDITKRELAQYFHAAAFSLVKSTFLAAINNGHFTSWPGLFAGLISKHLPQSPFTLKGHLDQEQKNLCSTQSHQESLDDIHPNQEQNSYNILATIINTNQKTSKSYSNQTGCLPRLSSR